MPRKLRKRDSDSSGHRWVDENYDALKEIKLANGGLIPFTPAFTTSEFEGSQVWCEENLPEILFYLQPPTAANANLEPGFMLDSNGKEMFSVNGQSKLRQIPVLPDRIAVNVPGWMLVAWRRLDPRIKLQDITDRMTTDLGNARHLTSKTITIPRKNCLQNNCARNCRKLLNYYNDYGRRLEPHRAEVEAIAGLTMNNIQYNTILPYNAQFHRLVKVKFVRFDDTANIRVQPMEVTEHNLYETTYPVNYFLFDGYDPELSDSMADALSILLTVQERAIKHGLDPACWGKLERSCLPSSWFDRTKTKSDANETYDGGCEICTWKEPADDHWNTIKIKKYTPRTPGKRQSKGKGIITPNSQASVSGDSSPSNGYETGSASYSTEGTVTGLDSGYGSISSSARKRKSIDGPSTPTKRSRRTTGANQATVTEAGAQFNNIDTTLSADGKYRFDFLRDVLLKEGQIAGVTGQADAADQGLEYGLLDPKIMQANFRAAMDQCVNTQFAIAGNANMHPLSEAQDEGVNFYHAVHPISESELGNFHSAQDFQYHDYGYPHTRAFGDDLTGTDIPFVVGYSSPQEFGGPLDLTKVYQPELDMNSLEATNEYSGYQAALPATGEG